MILIFMILTPLCILAIFGAFAYSTLHKKQHKLLCDEFYKEFGCLPDEVVISQAGGIFFTFQKDIYFLRPLIFNIKSIFVKKMNSDHYYFIRNQPKDKVRWIKVEFSLLLTGFILFLANAFVFYGFIKA
ncbi:MULTISPECIES: hypothetical protein [Yersinia]|uniref:hypothetical protein n=1 Tax=Yersinia TaxID=629 RepID=UPI0011A9FCDE|nr:MULTISPECIES: hypothetical protein [Yersinia]EKN5109522.1 hypothetical protein [Yersinia enterocolitica]MBW5814590.1 hypothetical protein [Yersinia kristensenii]MBW5831758.1 hypothetical protein [Yersinia kristensenii]MBW5840966.1 hypothetical protein [Yersinia kristensenii]